MITYCTLRSKRISKRVIIYYIIGVYIINRTLHGRLPLLASEALMIRNQFVSLTLKEDCNASCVKWTKAVTKLSNFSKMYEDLSA